MSTRISHTLLSILTATTLLSCAAPIIQKATTGTPVVTSVPADKIKAIQAQVTEDDNALNQLIKDPKAYLKKQGITLGDDQQVQVLDMSTTLYLVLDERNLSLFQGDTTTTSLSANSQLLTNVRKRAASDPAYKAELLKNPADVLMGEGLLPNAATQVKVLDYQPGVDLLPVYSNTTTISRGSSDAPDWNLDLWRYSARGKEIPLPSMMRTGTRDILNHYAKGIAFLDFYQEEAVAKYRLEKIVSEFKSISIAACITPLNFGMMDFCAEYVDKRGSDGGFTYAAFHNFLSDPKAIKNPPASPVPVDPAIDRLTKQFMQLTDLYNAVAYSHNKMKDTPNLSRTDQEKILRDLTNVFKAFQDFQASLGTYQTDTRQIIKDIVAEYTRDFNLLLRWQTYWNQLLGLKPAPGSTPIPTPTPGSTPIPTPSPSSDSSDPPPSSGHCTSKNPNNCN